MNTKRRHTRCDHRRPRCLAASRQRPDDLPVREFRQSQLEIFRQIGAAEVPDLVAELDAFTGPRPAQ
jgi:hypothetical protein